MTHLPRSLFLLLGGLAAALAGSACNTHSSAFPKDFKPVIVQFNLETPRADASTATPLPLSGQRIPYDPTPVLTEGDIIGVKILPTQMGSCAVFSLTADASRQFYLTSGAHQGLRLVVTINGVPTGVFKINEAIETGTLPVYLEMSDADLPDVVKGMNATCVELQKRLR